MPRAPYDEAMLKPSQPCFSAGAFCRSPVFQRRDAPVIIDGDDIVDSRALVPPLSDREKVEALRLRTEAKAAAEPECAPIRAAWLDEQIEKAVTESLGLDATPAERQAAIDAFDRATLEKAAKGELDHLPLDFVITLKDGQRITVEGLLTAGMKYHGAICYDPLRPEYLAGKLYLDGLPNLHSQAGLKPTWELGRKIDRKLLRRRQFVNADALKKAMGL